ncbi:MAG: hypothetical protein EA424_06450, partial [Planctomycetaceae bacterium]
MGHVIAGPGAQGPVSFEQEGRRLDYRFELALEPGETQIVMSFGVQDWDTAAALDRVAMLEQTPEFALAGMTADELAAVVNFSPSLADWYSLEVAEPTMLTITTTTPGDASGEFSNTLDPMLALYAPGGTRLAEDDNSAADGRNAVLTHSVTELGTYRVLMQPVAGIGPYTLQVSSSESSDLAVEPFSVVDADLPSGQTLYLTPDRYTVSFSHGLLLTSVEASDLEITDPESGLFHPAYVNVLDGDRLQFDLTGMPMISGTYQVHLAAGSVLDVRGEALQDFTTSFELDVEGPQVTWASLETGAVLTPGPLTFEATFSDPLREEELGAEDVMLLGLFSDQVFLPTSFAYDAVEQKVTVEFPGLPEDAYGLSLLSGEGHFEGLLGQALDGDGDGVAGGDYVVHFSVDSDTEGPLPALEPVWPLGSLIYRAGAVAAISPAEDVDTYTIDLDAGQAVSVVVRPTSTLQPVVELIRQDDSQSLGVGQASEPGQPAMLQMVGIEAGGTYMVSVSGGSSVLTVGGYALDLVLNAHLEAESAGGAANDTRASAQDIDGSFLTLGGAGQRGAVLGDLPTGTSDVDWYAFSLDENQTATLNFTGQDAGSFSLDLYDVAGERLATGIAPSMRSNVDQRITGYRSLSGGTYYAAVGGVGEYSLVVTRGMELDVEPNNRPIEAQWLSPAQAVVGSLGRTWRGQTSGWSDSITTTFNANNGAAGNMFDVTTFAHPLSVTALDVNANTTGSFTLEVYTRPGGYEGFESNAAAWTLVSSSTVTGQGSGNPTFVDVQDFVLEANAVTGLYVTAVGASLRYTNGSATYNNDDLQLDLGVGKSYPFGSTFSPRIWNGTIYYEAAGDREDVFLFAAEAGDELVLTTATPGDGPFQPDNDLDPLLELYNPAGTLVASNNDWPIGDGGDGRNSRILYTVPEGAGGTYRVRVSGVWGSGDYTLQVAGATGVREVPLTVTAASIDDGTTLDAWPGTIQLDFDSPLLLTSVQAADLTVNGTPADGVTVVDGDTLLFDITGALDADGVYTVALAADVMENLFGSGNTALSLSFTLDTTSPVVTTSSIDAGQIIEPGNLTYTVTFSEALETDGLGPEDVTLVENTFGTPFAPTDFDYDPETYTLTVDFHGLYDGVYTLTLISGPDAFRDLVGNQLNGWPSHPLPSGQGHPAPDDFVLNFFVDAAADLPYPVPLEPKAPLGGLIFDPSVRGSIHVAGDFDGYAVELDSEQTVTVVLTPQGGLQGSIELLGPGDVSIATASAAAADETVVLQTAPAADAGTYRVLIGGVDSSTGGYTARLILNAAVELEEHGGARNDDLDSAQDLSGSLIDLGGGIQRAAVLGQAQQYAGGTVSRISGVSYGASLATLTDGVFRPRGTWWTSGTVYWYDVNTQFEIVLDSVETITGARVQADNNDQYQLDWYDADDEIWKPLWIIPDYSDRIGGGVITRPDYPLTDSDEFQTFAEPVTTDRLRFRAVSGDGNYSASEIQLQVVGDFYSLELDAGEAVSSVVTAAGVGNVSLELLDAAGTPLAAGLAGPSNVSQAISDFLAPATGTYYWRVWGDGEYSLVIVRGAAFDQEPNDTPETAQPISTTGAVLGHLWRTAGESFESGEVPQLGWSTSSSGSGRIRVMDQHGAGSGDFALVMDSASGWARNEAVWTVDLEGATEATLSFQHRSFGSEANQTLPAGPYTWAPNADGVAFSPDGTTWYRLWSPVLSTTWQTVTVDLVAQAAARGIELSDSMQIKFQQYDQYAVPDGGRAFDNISITTDASVDQYLVEVVEGDPLTITTTTPGGGAGEPVNTLVPRIELFAPDGTSVGSNSSGAADGRNALLEHVAAASGTYRMLVTAVSGTGAYTMRIDGATGTQTFHVLSSDPVDGARLADFPATFRVDLSEGVLLTSLEPSDLQITLPDSTIVPADAVTLIDARTLEFAIASAAADDGPYQLSLAAGSLTAVSGTLLESFDATFEFDTTGPIVVDTSIPDGGTINAGLLTWTVTFNEPLATEGLGPEDVTLAAGGDSWNPDTFDYEQATDTLTVTFDYVLEGDYTLTLASGPTAFRDLVGNLLDGNADGTPGDPYTISFTVNTTEAPLAAPFAPVEPLGSLIYTTVHPGLFGVAEDVDVLTAVLDAGQTATVLFTPLDASIRAEVQWIGPSGVLETATAAAAGEVLLIQTAPVAEDGTYRIQLTALDGTGGYEVRVVLNAGLEHESVFASETNDLQADSQDLNGSAVVLNGGADRLAVVGVADGSTPDYYAWQLTEGQYATVVVHGQKDAPVEVELYDSDGALLAIGSTGATNVDQHIRLFRAPVTGTYHARITGAAGTSYALVVTRDADFEIEPNGDAESALSSLAYVDTVLGHVGGKGGSLHVGLLAADNTGNAADVRTKLENLGWFDSITVIHVNSTTPTLETLQAFDSVVLWSWNTFANSTQLGNVLADYVDGGGGVVIQTFATSSTTYSPQGRWRTDGYHPIAQTGWTSGSSLTLGTVADPAHPIMDGVSSFSGGSSSWRGTGALAADANLIASWSNGTPLVADLLTFESPIVLLNFYPPSSSVGSGLWDASTDGDLLMGNALRYAAGVTDRADFYRFPVDSAQTFTLETSRPAGGAGQFVNDLDPEFELRDPNGVLVSHTNIVGDESLTHTAAVTGDYLLRVFGADEPGEYVLRATGLPFAPLPLVVTAADPEDGALLSAYPAVYRVVFSEPILLTTLEPGDLTVDGVPADGLTLIDARTVDFTIASADTGDGLYHVEIAAGTITSLSGQGLEAFSATFDYDATNPTVIASSIWEGDVVPPGSLVYQVQFSEELATADLGAEDVTLVDSISGGSVAADAFEYDPGTSTATVTYDHVPEGNYTLTLLTSATAFRDRRGNLLDGSPSFPLPSGDGTPGDPFVVDFQVDRTTDDFPVPLAWVAPAGGLIHAGSVAGVLNTTGDVDAFTVDVDPGQTISLVLIPQSGDPQARLELLAPDDASLGAADASAAGQTVYLQTLPAADGGTYRIQVSSLDGVGAYDLRVILNAALEEESWGGDPNNDLAGAQDLAAAWIEVGNGSQRVAVLGTADGAGGTADVYRVDLDAGDVLTWLLTGSAGNQPTFEVMDASGTVLALGAGGTVGAGQSVTEFVVPDSGAYYARVAGSGDYSLLAVRNTGFRLADQVYFTDFESGAGPEWSTSITDNSVAAFTRFLGRFSNGAATLTLPTVPGRAYVVEFDLMIIDSWDGNSTSNGPDYFNVDVDGTRVFHHTFTTSGTNQTYPRMPDVSGQNFGWGHWNDAIYRGISIPFIASANSTAIRFYDGGLQGLHDESWGIDNVRVAAQDIGLTGRVLGHYDTGVDQYQFTAEEGDQLTIHTTTPGDGPGQPVNTFDAYLQLYGPEGLLVALDDDSGPQNDGRNAQILYTVPEGAAGAYTLRVQGTGAGAYTVNIEGATGIVSPLPEVVATMPVEGQRFAGPPTSLELTFSQWLRVDTLDAADLTLDGGATVTGIQVIDGRTVRYLLDVPDIEATYTYTLAAASVLDLQGDANPEYQGTFLIDKTGPRVVAQIPALQTSAPFTQLTFVFDEPINPVSFTTSDVTQFIGPGGANLTTQLTSVTVSGNQATVTFNAQSAQGTYIMRIGPDIEDLVGNKMDQNANGIPGEEGDYYLATVDLQSADLIVSSLDLPETAVFEAPITFSWTVQNIGSDPAVEGWKDQAWLSPDPVFNANAIPLLATPVSPPAGSIPLGANGTYTQTATVNLPLTAALSDGIYYILVKTDALDQQPEDNENNNFKSESISVALPPLPDLVVSSIDAPIEAFSGQNIQYSWTVTNQGTGPATGTWRDRVLLSTDTVVGNDLLLGNFSFTGTIEPGESITRTQTYTLPIAMEGDRWFIVRTDIYNEVFEHANEGNNTRVSDVPMTVQLSPFPNLQVTEVITPAEAFSSQQAVVQWVVTNTGDASTSAPVWYDRVWLSTDDVLDGSDTYLGQVANPSYLTPGDSYLNSLTVTLPQGIQGDYWFIVKTDAGNHVYEHNNEHDNVGVGPKTRVTMTPPPDLRVTEITGPDLAFSNQTVTVSWTVLNDDTTPGAGGRTLQTGWFDTVYLSSSPDSLVDAINMGRVW